MNSLSVASSCSQFVSGKCFALHFVKAQITGALTKHLSGSEGSSLMMSGLCEQMCWNIYVFQHLLTHCIFPTHQKLRFFSVKWSRNQSKLMADLKCPLCRWATCIRSHLGALQLVLSSPPWLKQDVFLVFSASFFVKVLLVLEPQA